MTDNQTPKSDNELSAEDRQWIDEIINQTVFDTNECVYQVARIATLRMKAKLSEVEKREAELKFLLKLSRSYLPNGWVNDGKGNGFMFKDRLEAALNNASNENNDKK